MSEMYVQYHDYLTWSVEELKKEYDYISSDIEFINNQLDNKSVRGEQKSELLNDLREDKERLMAIKNVLISKEKSNESTK